MYGVSKGWAGDRDRGEREGRERERERNGECSPEGELGLFADKERERSQVREKEQ